MGDGKLDLVIGNRCADSGCQSGLSSVGVLLGNGDGTFQTAVSYDSGGGPFEPAAVAIADLNGDHKPDILVTNAGSSTVGVLLGNGDGTFQPVVVYGSGGLYPASVAVADVNDDGKPDLLVANVCGNGDPNCDGTVGVLLGNGDGTFQAAVTYSSGGRLAKSVAVADVDGDGHPDILLTTESVGCNGNNGGAVSVLLGNGDGTFQAAVEYFSGGYQLLGVAVGDVNGDGRPDVLLANSCSFNSSDCGGPVNKTRGVVGVLLNNVGAPPTTTTLVSSINPAYINHVVTSTA